LYSIADTLLEVVTSPWHEKQERRAWEQLIEMAGTQGLKVKAPVKSRISGVVYGELGGYVVIMRPDGTGFSTITVLFKHEKVTMIGFRAPGDTDDAMPVLAPLSKYFRLVFGWCYSSGDELEKLRNHPEVLDHLVEFRARWMWHLSRVYINEQTLLVRLRRPHSIPAIPVQVAECLVPDMIKIVDELETVLGQSGKAVDIGWHLEE